MEPVGYNSEEEFRQDDYFDEDWDHESVADSTESGYNEPTEPIQVSIPQSLQDAMRMGLLPQVEELCSQIEDYEGFCLYNGWKPLSYAAQLGNVELVEYFINYERELALDINRSIIPAPLTLACSVQNENQGQDHFKCAELLLDAGADIEFKDLYGVSALMTACKNSPVEIVGLLLTRGATVEDKDNDGWSPLLYAANRGEKCIIELLLEYGADVNKMDNRSRYPHTIAVEKGFIKITDMLKPQAVEASERAAIEDVMLRLAAKKHNIVTDTEPEYLYEVSEMVAASAIGMERYISCFLDHKINFRQFLLLKDEEELRTIGVLFSMHRRTLVERIRQFHLSPWTRNSLGIPEPKVQEKRPIDMTIVLNYMATLYRQIYVLKTSLKYLNDEISKFPNDDSLQDRFKKMKTDLNQIILRLQLVKQSAKKIDLIAKPRLFAQEIV